MNTLKSIYACDLNERVRKYESETLVGKLLFSLPRTEQQSETTSRNNSGYLNNDTITDFFTKIHNIILSNN